MMTHILSKLPDEYDNMVENLEDGLDKNIDNCQLSKEFGTSNQPSMIELIHDTIKKKNWNQRRSCMYVNSRVHATTVVGMSTIV